MSESTRVAQERGVQFADGHTDVYFDRAEAEREVAHAKRASDRGYNDFAGAHVVTRTATTVRTDWEMPQYE